MSMNKTLKSTVLAVAGASLMVQGAKAQNGTFSPGDLIINFRNAPSGTTSGNSYEADLGTWNGSGILGAPAGSTVPVWSAPGALTDLNSGYGATWSASGSSVFWSAEVHGSSTSP